MSGFFTVLLTKTGSMESASQNPPARDFTHTSLTPISEADTQALEKELIETFGFPLKSLLKDSDLQLLARNQQVFLIPRGLPGPLPPAAL